MDLRLSSLLSLLLAVGVGAATFAAPTWVSSAWAADDDDDDDDDDDGGGDGDGDGDDDDDDDDGGDSQPAVTSGGLFIKRTYPVAELERPLTVLGGMLQTRAGFNIDVSNEGAFETWTLSALAAYGIKDWSEIQLGVDILLTEPEMAGGQPASILLAYEHAIQYDLVDFRVGVIVPVDPFQLDLFFGFPFRYKPKPQIAIIALDKLMTIHTVGVDVADGMGGTESSVPKPDLTVGIGIVFQAAPVLALILRGELVVTAFNFDNSVKLPATAAIQFSPNNKIDIGLEFTFANLKPPEVVDPVTMESSTPSPFDERSLLLFGQLRL